MNHHLRVLLGIAALMLIAGASGSQSLAPKHPAGAVRDVRSDASPAVTADADYGRMPLHFIANQGQIDGPVDYYVPGRDKSLYFSPGGVTIVMDRQEAGRSGMSRTARRDTAGPGRVSPGAPGSPVPTERWAVKLDFLGANPDCRPAGEDRVEAVYSYFRGRPEDWKTDVPAYSRIAYRGLWPGIDLVFHGSADRLKYGFVVRPGADPGLIRLAYRGARSVAVDPAGRLVVETPGGGFTDDAPAAYQEIGGEKAEVPLAYAIDNPVNDEGQRALTEREGVSGEPGYRLPDGAAGGGSSGRFVYGFEVGAYDKSQPLVIDPAVLVYCGFIGGSGTESGAGIAVDAAGNAYVTGTTTSTETSFPVAAGPDLTHDAGPDAFVAKVKADGTGLVYCGFIGGDGADYGNGIAVDAAGCAYVAGTTDSNDTTFPVVVGPDLEYGATGTGGYPDAFVAKLNAAGTALVYCGYIGGRDEDRGTAIGVDGSGCAYVTGFTTNDETLSFPVVVGPDVTFNGVLDTFVTKVNASGTGFAYSGYVGGPGSEYGYAITVDASGNAYIAGTAYAGGLPATVGPDLTFNGLNDVFVASVNASGTALDYCGYIGGDGSDEASGIAVDGAGCAYVVGHTLSSAASFPLAVGPDLSPNGDRDAFVAKVSAAGSGLDYCGYIGGSLNEYGYGIAVDGKGNAYLTGETASAETSFPVVSGPDLTYNGNRDAFIAKVRPGGYGFEYSGYIGGSGWDLGFAVAVDGAGNAYVTGRASFSAAPGFSVTGGPDLTFNGGPDDAFVAKIQHFDENIAKHAVGDFDGDGADEAAVDFGANGVWLWDGGAWGQITPADAENLLAAQVDQVGGRANDEIIADLGGNGVWVWNAGVWTVFSSMNAENLAASDMDWDGSDELIGDFGASGLWIWDGGGWTQVAGIDAQYAIALSADGAIGQELAADFGPAGLWLWGLGGGNTWSQISGANPSHIRPANFDGLGAEDLAADFGSLGAWVWSAGAWAQISGVPPDYLIAANVDGAAGDEIVGDFGATGLWLWSGGAWTQLSGINADHLISADTDGDGSAEVLADLGATGLWLWNAGAWTQISGANPEFMSALDGEPDGRKEIMTDFGNLGLWLWDEGAWSQLSALNPD